MSDWYRVEGNFVPRSPNLGKHYDSSRIEKICSIIEKQKTKMICIDDFGKETDEEFEKTKKKLVKAFEKILPDKSAFEI